MEEVPDLIAGLPEPEKLITKRLRSLILDAAPRLQEMISYGVPYFYHYRRVCFLWPASCIPCGMTRPDLLKVTLGFCYGSMLSNEQGLLVAEKRKQVYVVPIYSLSQINERAIVEIVQEAVLLDDEFGKAKKKKLR